MAELLKVKARIKSVRNLRQITGAIELVAKIKINGVKLQHQNRAKYKAVVEDIFSTVSESYKQPVLEPQAAHIVCVFFSQKGFCGAFNPRLIKRTIAEVASFNEPVEVWCIGRKSKRWDYAFNFPFKHLTFDEKNYITELETLLAQWHQDWLKGKVRSINLIYNQFRSILVQDAEVVKLYPFKLSETDISQSEPIYETKPSELFPTLLLNWWRAVVETAYWEGLVSENCARLVSMKSANDNADVMLEQLHLTYNKVRQATITQELSEVVTAFDVLGNLSQTVVRKEWFQ